METKNFITKWALTDGIVECPRKFCYPDDEKEGVGRYHYQRFGEWWFIGTNYIHDTLENAQAHAEQMRLAEIEKLQSKITKLQELRF